MEDALSHAEVQRAWELQRATVVEDPDAIAFADPPGKRIGWAQTEHR